MRTKQENKIIEQNNTPLITAYINQTTTKMKTRYKIAVWALVAVAGSLLLGGNFWWWLAGLLVGKFVIRILFTIALAIVIYCLVYAFIIGGILWILIG
ncbi:hypothetical protein [Bacteroides fragilis]|jgi:hypothetical protein|uniref:hypothetical protein n=2 Tax=Bacteroides TaxID=816 RepID=UPI003B3B2930